MSDWCLVPEQRADNYCSTFKVHFLSVCLFTVWFSKVATNGCGQADVAGFKVRKFHFNCMLIRIPDDRGEHSARNSACPLLATVGILLQTAEERFWPLSPAGRGFCPAFSLNKLSEGSCYPSRSNYSWLSIKKSRSFFNANDPQMAARLSGTKFHRIILMAVCPPTA